MASVFGPPSSLASDDRPASLATDKKHLRIGCLRFDGLYDPSTPSASSGTWRELTRHALDIRQGKFSPLHSDAVKLISARWIRAERQRVDACELWRIYYLPDDVSLASIPRSSKPLRKALENVLVHLDVSSSTWNGKDHSQPEAFDLWASPDDHSLFYMFNTLHSPEPSPDRVKDLASRATIERLLDLKTACRGLKTSLYPYQRRAAAAMIERETSPSLQLDPRLEPRRSVDGAVYYYGPRDRTLLRHPRHYDTMTGGILAETMGLGKTLICISAILATLGQVPRIPPQYPPPEVARRDTVGSLVHMAAHSAVRHQLAWKGYFQDIKEQHDEEMSRCVSVLQSYPPEYTIPPRILRQNLRRKSETVMTSSTRVLMSSATIIVVPRNLVHQWRSELEKHVNDGALRIFVVDAPKVFLPSPAELASFDVILFSRPRFELENKQTEQLYESPLKSIHWLRIIIDEGHGFSSTNTHAVHAAERLVKADRRWIVSGTPAKDLLGVEVELGSLVEADGDKTHAEYRKKSLSSRRTFSYQQELHSGAVKSLGALASRFLKAQPWSSSDFLEHMESAAQWEDHVYRHEDFRARTYSCFSTCLRRTLQTLVIKTQPDDVERDLVLPPLTHEIIRLQPSTYDKLTANLFVLLFTANAITSERSDQDYLFHKNSLSHLHRLTANLRQSGFAWSGFDEASVQSSLKVAQSYLDKEGTLCSEEDRVLMHRTMQVAGLALNLPGWRALSRTQELGLASRAWPNGFRHEWAFPDCEEPMLMSLTQALQAQRFVNGRLADDAPLSGFSEAGIAARIAAEEARIYAEGSRREADAEAEGMRKTGIPSVGVMMDDMGSKRLSISGVTTAVSPRKAKSMRIAAVDGTPTKASPKGKKRRRLSNHDSFVALAGDSELGKTQLAGTTSAKLSYLIDRVAALQAEEKILIFYEAPHIAYYISQTLDLLHVKHLIYANTLSGEQRSKYVVLFDSDASHRVLLMDLRQAAHGLNLSSASRVFFVNPALRPDTEAQAIKRAHRIGQTRPVRVETLLLSGTIEEAMHDRAAKMTRGEHLAARTLEEDEGIRGIIQSARVLPIQPEEMLGEAQLARLSMAQQLFGRPGRGDAAAVEQSGLEKELFGEQVRSRNALDALVVDGDDERLKPKRPKADTPVSMARATSLIQTPSDQLASDAVAAAEAGLHGVEDGPVEEETSIFGR